MQNNSISDISHERLNKALEFAEEIEDFPLGRCGPSDDPDKQTAYVYAFKEMAKRFLGAARRVPSQAFRASVEAVNSDITLITEAYDLRTDILALIDELRELNDHPELLERVAVLSTEFVSPSKIQALQSIRCQGFDLTKVAQFCKEINDAYSLGNYISVTLLIRALLNHVPPIFGQTSFAQVVSQMSSKSVRDLLKPLDDIARDVGDLHTHEVISARVHLPTKNQVDPFRANIEILINELISKIEKII